MFLSPPPPLPSPLHRSTVSTSDRPVLGVSTLSWSMPGSIASSVSGLLLHPSLLRMPMVPVCVDSSHVLHPFSGNRFDAGPVRLASIFVIIFCYIGGQQVPAVYWCLLRSLRRGTVPFVSDRAGAYGRLLLAIYECMMTGGLLAQVCVVVAPPPPPHRYRSTISTSKSGQTRFGDNCIDNRRNSCDPSRLSKLGNSRQLSRGHHSSSGQQLWHDDARDR